MILYNLEIACFNIASARLAAGCGVSRIELCAQSELGGTTPEVNTAALQALKTDLKIPIFIMIRPRGGNFVYTNIEFQTMRLDIRRLRDIADGFTFGVLDGNNMLDIARNRLLVEDANGKLCTLHRAFDQTPDLYKSLDEAIKCGFSTVLTSGGAITAVSGAEILRQLVEMAGNNINIMPGGGIRSDNIGELKQKSRAIWFHSAAKTQAYDDIPDIREIVKLRNLLEGSAN